MGYFSTWTESASGGVRLLAPYGLMAVLFLFGSFSFAFPAAGTVKAPFLLMAVYYWSIYRPSLVPPWFVFSIGILSDLAGGLPLGLTALVFVAMRWILADQRKFLMGQSFSAVWIGFVILSAAAGAAQWIVFGLISGVFPSPRSLLVSTLFGVALFPAVCVALHLTYKLLPSVETSFVIKRKNR